ncbi:Phage integrase family protein [Corynebacterium fournieri]|nr:Phage integrase family protein [Corynebacterium fournieri]
MARGRPATPLGTWGEIHVKELASGKLEASTRLRLWNGETVRLRARGKSATAAQNNLKARCTERLGTTDTQDLTTTSTVGQLLEFWLDGKTDIRPQSRDRYRRIIDLHLEPAFGKLRIREVSPALLDAWLRGQTSGVAATSRTVLSGAFSMAARFGLVVSNPMLAVEPVNRPRKEVRALTRDEIPRFRAAIAKSENETLIDVVDVALATGLRAGELLALRWEDLHLDEASPRLEVSGTLVYSKELGHRRQEEGKTSQARRPVQLSESCATTLRRRREKYGTLPMVFPSGAGSYVWENNFNRWLREWRGEEFKWVTIHSLRKTLGSLVYEELGPHRAAEVLGHSNSTLTETVYVQRNSAGVAIGDLVDNMLDGVQKMSEK